MIEINHNSFSKYRSVYRYALFSSPVIVVVYLNSYFPQIIISDKLGDAILGVYSAALLFCLAIQVLSTGFTTFWSPYMYKNYKTENVIIKKIHDVVLFACVLVLSLVLLFNDVFYLFIGEVFRKNQNILGMLLIYPIVLILVETTAYGISIKKKNEIILIIYLISTAVNVLLCFGLVSKFGLTGIAAASMVAGIVHMILMTYFGQKYYRSIESTFRTLIHTVILIFSAVLFYLYYDNRMIFVIAELIMIAICLFYDKNVILWGFRIIKQNRNK
jgi:O-antigen/teichoic acid export membrane protein